MEVSVPSFALRFINHQRCLYTADFMVRKSALLRSGQRGVHAPPGDVLLGSGHLRPLHADSERHQQGSAAAHWHNVTLHRL